MTSQRAWRPLQAMEPALDYDVRNPQEEPVRKVGPLSELRQNWKDATWWKHKYKDRVLINVLRNNGVFIVNEDWDNLVILDSCRYDVFEELNTIQGKLESRISRGTCTEEFLQENFVKFPQTDFSDIVYVAGNPYVSKFLNGRFHKTYPVWDYGWDESLKTIPPDPIMKETLRAARENPGKRLIAHFMQPHEPFLETRLHDTGITEHRKSVIEKRRRQYTDVTVWDLIQRGELKAQDAWAAYRRNLELVLPYVAVLVRELVGKTVITSDHGNLFGERPHWLYPFKELGHPAGLHVRALQTVPWLIAERNS